LVTEDLKIGYEAAAPLLSIPDALVIRGETVAIIGPNGVGKSTLLKTIAGDLPPLQGQLRLGAQVKFGYLAQAYETLSADNSILDEIMAAKAMPLSQARDFLGRFMFSDDDVFRSMATLSGGERGRVALAKLSLAGANLLLLDEPTNHLDIDSQEILQAVLESFAGAILLASHDRYLIDALATQIWEMTPGALHITDGSYQHFIRARNQRLESGAQVNEKRPSASNGRRGQADSRGRPKLGLTPFAAERRAAQLEARISALEDSLQSLGEQLTIAGDKGDVARVRQLGLEYTRTESELETILDEWGKLVE
jgi:ATP-binding cassette subfamily F protein 3